MQASSGTWAYLGAWTSPDTGTTLTRRETQIGRRLAIAHVYHDWNDAFPTRRERAWPRHGRILGHLVVLADLRERQACGGAG